MERLLFQGAAYFRQIEHFGAIVRQLSDGLMQLHEARQEFWIWPNNELLESFREIAPNDSLRRGIEFINREGQCATRKTGVSYLVCFVRFVDDDVTD